MKRITVIICFAFLVTACWADDLLTGTPISGDGWRGLDLGTPHVITIVGWNPMSSTTAELGLFEGANRPDFLDAIPLYIHEGASIANQMNYARVQCSRGVRYVRYLKSAIKGEYKIQALEFYGDAGAGDDSHLYQLTNLPTVVIHTKDNQAPYDKEHEIDCFISIISNNGQTILSDSATIRERGNASRNFPKKPYRIKFAKKHQVLGSPANAKKWTLINNYGDKTLMRNQLAFELSRRFGMPYTPFCAYVDVVLNGDYKGSYQLCDQIEVRKNR
ncbi:MAG: CotH kinase family protein, partial [Paludibacteraceae bacterium]|nr:CotH kinase family protein [Paludibacteraceae bacterium]